MRQHLTSVVAAALTIGSLACEAQSYSNAVMALSPAAYWPLNETNPSPGYIATNYGTAGKLGTAYYDTPYNIASATPYTPFTGPVAGVTSDGDMAASFPGSGSAGDPNAYMVIPHDSPALTIGSTPFTTEVWVQPGGGDPNDVTGSSYASTEWAAIVKQGYGGNGYGDPTDPGGDGAGWCISLQGIYSLGYPVGWYTPGPTQLLTNATWVVDFFSGNNGGTPSLEFQVPMYEPTPAWFHLVLVYDGTNANFYTNGVLAATTLPNLPQSTNKVWAPNQPGAVTSPTGAYAFAPHNGVSFAPDKVNPIILGDLVVNNNFYNQGYPNSPNGTIGFNNQIYQGAMDELAIYTNALPAATVTQHYTDATASNKTLYTNDVLSAHPVVYLRLDEPAYTPPDPSTLPVATNYGTMGSPGSGVYQPGTVPGVAGVPVAGFGSNNYAVRINGLDASVDIGGGNLPGSVLDPTGTTPFSLSYWFKGNPADSYDRFQTTIGRGDAGWRSSIDQNGKLRWNPGAGPELTSAQAYNDGAWHHFVGVTDGTSDYLYIDGALSVSNSPVGSAGGSVFDVLIGGAPDYTLSRANGNYERYFAGTIAQAAFFTNALTASQVQSLYFAASVPPFITRQPPASTVIVAGSNGVISFASSGTPPVTYSWYLNGTKITDGGTYLGTGTTNLIITNAITADGGSYTAVISNAYGAVTSTVDVVTIASAPVIVTQPLPTNVTVYAGNQVSFSVSASGAVPLRYQWYKDTVPVSGATNATYTFKALAGSNVYSVTVSNALGIQPSSNATVLAQKFVPPPTGFAINYNDTGNGVYQGLGAYPDAPANTNWNAFPTAPGGTTGAANASSGTPTLATYSMVYGFNNGANNNAPQGSPCALVEYEAGVNSGNPGAGTTANPMGTFTFNDVPQGTYTLYVYSANYDGNRGSIISLAPANGGQADGGTNATTNVQSDHTCDTLVEGDNYVFFHGVVPDATGTISGSYIANPNGQLTGEGQIDAVQLVMDIATIQRNGNSLTISWTGGTLYSAPTASGPWTVVNATSPTTVTATGSQQYFSVY